MGSFGVFLGLTSLSLAMLLWSSGQVRSQEGSCEPARISIVSDATNVVDDDAAAVPYSKPYHPLWTASIPGATWIWKTNTVKNPFIDETHRFSKSFQITGKVAKATLQVAADNTYDITVNDIHIHVDSDDAQNFTLQAQRSVDVARGLREGTNKLTIKVTNIGQDTCAYSGGPSDPRCNPAGLLYRLDVDVACPDPCVPAASL